MSLQPRCGERIGLEPVAIESTFATVRLRTARTKSSGSRVACLAMVFKLAHAVQSKWCRLNGSRLLADIIRGVRSKNGIEEAAGSVRISICDDRRYLQRE